MGYLNNASIVVDARLTKKGRQLLAKGRDEFSITQFALADDEIDYSLWNIAHPLGSDYYGITIENMPLIEAVSEEAYMMKYKLVTLSKRTTKIPVISVPAAETGIVITYNGAAKFKPTTTNFDKGNALLGYTAILSNSDVAFIRATVTVPNSALPTAPRFIGDDEAAQSVSVSGFEFEVIGKSVTADKYATITVIGNETGGRVTINLTVKKPTT